MCACVGGHLDVAQYLLTQGAKVDAKDNVSSDIMTIFILISLISFVIY